MHGFPWLAELQHVPTRNRDSTVKNKYYPMWCLLKMRHAVFTTCCLCCTDGTQTSMPTVYFNKARLSLIVLTISASAKSLRILKVPRLMIRFCFSLTFQTEAWEEPRTTPDTLFLISVLDPTSLSALTRPRHLHVGTSSSGESLKCCSIPHSFPRIGTNPYFEGALVFTLQLGRENIF